MPQDIQGRVFSARIVVAWFVIPIASLIAGPLADQVMEPAMQPGGGLAEAFGWLVGTGPGAGMGLIYVLTGVLGVAAVAGFTLIPAVREIEDRLPDHDAGRDGSPEPGEAPAR